MKQWINNLLDKVGEKWGYVLFCVLIIAGLFLVSTIHYFLFTKPVEDRVNAEWQEKYDEMVFSYEEQIEQVISDYSDATDLLVREAYDKGYEEGYAVGYDDGYFDGEHE